jgi:hypothetical protein
MYQRFSHTARRGAGRSQNFRLVTIAWICNKNLAPFHPTAIERIVMPNPKKIHVLKLFVLGGWASLLLAIPSISRSQTATPEVQPSPAPETSPSSPVSPVESPVQPAPPALPAESSGTAQPAQTPISPLIPPAAGPGHFLRLVRSPLSHPRRCKPWTNNFNNRSEFNASILKICSLSP